MTFRGDHPDELISASLNGDLTDAERAALDAHLARCERCRATLAAFKSERRILSGLPVADPPRDLSARVRGGIESGRFGGPWWRRPGRQVPLLASAGVFAAVVLSVVYFGHLLPAPVGQASGSPVATISFAPSSSVVASTAPSAGPSAPATFLAAGQLGYLELSGASLQPVEALLRQRRDRRLDRTGHRLRPTDRRLALTRRAVARLHHPEGRDRRQRGVGAPRLVDAHGDSPGVLPCRFRSRIG